MDLSGLVILLVLLKVILVAWLVAIAMLVDEYKKKCGPDEKTPSSRYSLLAFSPRPLLSG